MISNISSNSPMEQQHSSSGNVVNENIYDLDIVINVDQGSVLKNVNTLETRWTCDPGCGTIVRCETFGNC